MSLIINNDNRNTSIDIYKEIQADTIKRHCIQAFNETELTTDMAIEILKILDELKGNRFE